MITGAETAHLSHRPASIYLEGKLPLVTVAQARELGLHNGQIIEATPHARGGGWSLQWPGGQLTLPPDVAASGRWISGEPMTLRVQLQSDGSMLLRPIAPQPSVGLDPLLPDRSLQLLHRPADPGRRSRRAARRAACRAV